MQGAHQLHRAAHLRFPGVAPAGPDLGREKRVRRRRGPDGARRQQVADNALGAAVHRGRIDHAATAAEERLQHLGQRRALSGAAPESGPAPTSNVCQVPRPTIGISSPVRGIGRVAIGPCI